MLELPCIRLNNIENAKEAGDDQPEEEDKAFEADFEAEFGTDLLQVELDGADQIGAPSGENMKGSSTSLCELLDFGALDKEYASDLLYSKDFSDLQKELCSQDPTSYNKSLQDYSKLFHCNGYIGPGLEIDYEKVVENCVDDLPNLVREPQDSAYSSFLASDGNQSVTTPKLVDENRSIEQISKLSENRIDYQNVSSELSSLLTKSDVIEGQFLPSCLNSLRGERSVADDSINANQRISSVPTISYKSVNENVNQIHQQSNLSSNSFQNSQPYSCNNTNTLPPYNFGHNFTENNNKITDNVKKFINVRENNYTYQCQTTSLDDLTKPVNLVDVDLNISLHKDEQGLKYSSSAVPNEPRNEDDNRVKCQTNLIDPQVKKRLRDVIQMHSATGNVNDVHKQTATITPEIYEWQNGQDSDEE